MCVTGNFQDNSYQDKMLVKLGRRSRWFEDFYLKTKWFQNSWAAVYYSSRLLAAYPAFRKTLSLSHRTEVAGMCRYLLSSFYRFGYTTFPWLPVFEWVFLSGEVGLNLHCCYCCCIVNSLSFACRKSELKKVFLEKSVLSEWRMFFIQTNATNQLTISEVSTGCQTQPPPLFGDVFGVF